MKGNVEITINIKKILNLKDLKLKLTRNGINIIVGQNNVGKTRLLDHLYYENEQWDGLNEKYENGPHGYKHKSLPIFFGSYTGEYEGYFPVCEPNHKGFEGKEKMGDIECSYELYYFDLESSIFSFLDKFKEQKTIKKEVKFEKIRGRSCHVYYTEENTYRGLGSLKSVIMESFKDTEKLIPLTLEYKDKKGDFDMDAEHGPRGRNPGMKISHSLAGTGTGLLKYKSLEALSEYIIKKYKNKVEKMDRIIPFRYSEWENFVPILIIDEPELLLHPLLINKMANLIKGLKKNNIATIITTHSPSFLSHFIHSDTLNLVIMQKSADGNLEQPSFFWEIIKKIEKEIKEEYEYFARRSEKIDQQNFYISKWKRLLNEETLKILFSKQILFVEGMTEYVLFNSILREKLNKEMKDREIEIVPIFGKYQYIFFASLARELKAEFWFLFDDDRRKKVEKGQNEWMGEENGKFNKKFWENFGEGKNNEELAGITRSNDTKINWIHHDIENFLGIPLPKEDKKNKEYNLISRANEIFDNLEKEPKKLETLKKIISSFRTREEDE